MQLKDKVAIITGSSKGIGEGIARVFSSEGAKVAIVCRSEKAGKKTADELGAAKGMAVFIKTDVSCKESIMQMIEKTVSTFGKVDILVNNAGCHIGKTVEETSEDEWDLIQNTNLKSTFLCCKYAIHYLRKTKGNIVNISSMAGLVGQSNAGAYLASKGGQISMSKGMAIDFAPDGIRVNVICPGWVQTPVMDDWFSQHPAAHKHIFDKHPLGRIGTIEECGKAALFLASKNASFITGITLNIDGGITLGYLTTDVP